MIGVAVSVVLWLLGIYLMDALLSHDPPAKGEAAKIQLAGLRILWPVAILGLVLWVVACRLLELLGHDDDDSGAPR